MTATRISMLRARLARLTTAANDLRPPTPPFTDGEAEVFENELKNRVYIESADKWAAHYEKQADEMKKNNDSWKKSRGGKADPIYTRAEEKFRWLASAWNRVDKAKAKSE